ncbi:MAG TPA: YihY/virulence factor BrkB family protein [Blastocatellia bacterium]|nr:YihY/virulence factor BrkB family protein [Blastocatellia bacterium]
MRVYGIDLWSLIKGTVRKWNADNCLRLGASLSYYTLFSLFPLILVVLFIIRLLYFNSDPARDAILDALANVTGGFREDFLTALEAASRTRQVSGIFGIVLLVLGASWVFGELVSAFNIIWDVELPWGGGPFEFVRLTFSSFALMLAVAFLLLVSMIVSAVLAVIGSFLSGLPGGVLVWGGVQVILNLYVLTLIFALIFKYVPQTRVTWRDVWLGAALTAVVWSLFQLAISYYIAFSSYKDYGAIGSILALITWVYLSSQILFLGGEFTAVFARKYGSRSSKAAL